ncbi:MAG: hypothetical protein GY714_09600 [Desulfobacterales bacterium]|nr:hypothetical protein [Desulfobacterales bacterium]
MNKFPKYLNRPLKIIIFDADIFCISVFCVVLAYVYGGIFWTSLIIPKIYSYFKKKFGNNFINQFTYIVGLTTPKYYPNKHENKFLE